MAIRQNPTIERLTTRHGRLSRGLSYGTILSPVAAPLAAIILTTSILVAVAVWGVAMVAGLPLLRVRSDMVLRTEEPPAVVREELTNLRDPLSVVYLGIADEVRDPPEDTDDVAAVCRVSALGLISRDVPISMTWEGEHDVRLQFGEDGRVGHTTEVSIEADGDGTRFEATVFAPRVQPFRLLGHPLQNYYSRRILDHSGYQVVSAETAIGLRFV